MWEWWCVPLEFQTLTDPVAVVLGFRATLAKFDQVCLQMLVLCPLTPPLPPLFIVTLKIFCDVSRNIISEEYWDVPIHSSAQKDKDVTSLAVWDVSWKPNSVNFWLSSWRCCDPCCRLICSISSLRSSSVLSVHSHIFFSREICSKSFSSNQITPALE